MRAARKIAASDSPALGDVLAVIESNRWRELDAEVFYTVYINGIEVLEGEPIPAEVRAMTPDQVLSQIDSLFENKLAYEGYDTIIWRQRPIIDERGLVRFRCMFGVESAKKAGQS